MHDIDLTEASWLMRPDADLPVGKLESRIIIDSRPPRHASSASRT